MKCLLPSASNTYGGSQAGFGRGADAAAAGAEAMEAGAVAFVPVDFGVTAATAGLEVGAGSLGGANEVNEVIAVGAAIERAAEFSTLPPMRAGVLA